MLRLLWLSALFLGVRSVGPGEDGDYVVFKAKGDILLKVMDFVANTCSTFNLLQRHAATEVFVNYENISLILYDKTYCKGMNVTITPKTDGDLKKHKFDRRTDSFRIIYAKQDDDDCTPPPEDPPGFQGPLNPGQEGQKPSEGEKATTKDDKATTKKAETTAKPSPTKKNVFFVKEGNDESAGGSSRF